jgi:hypothetical protein
MTNTPDNQPFEFNLDAYVKGLDLQPFRFHWKDRRWELAHFDSLDSWEMMKALKSGNDEAVLRIAMGADQFGELRQIPLPLGGLQEVTERYFKHCGVDVGELRGSAGS